MSPTLLALCSAGVLLLAAPASGQADSIALRELRELRQLVEQQSKQIESLTQQVGKLAQTAEAQKGSAPVVTVSPTVTEIPPANPAPEAAKAEPTILRAEAAVAGPKHTVAKGETLTSIAKQYNIPLADLQKHNKIENDRKLQIGQTLVIPTPKTPKPAPEKKENP